MALTVTDDFTTVDTMDAVGNNNVEFTNDTSKTPVVNTDVKVQGSGCNGSIVQGSFPALIGIAFIGTMAAGDFTRKHMMMWGFPSGIGVDTDANGGMRITISQTAAPAAANHSHWKVGGNDVNAIGFRKGLWQNYCVDTTRPYDFVVGTSYDMYGTTVPAQLSQVNQATFGENETGFVFVDEFKHGTGITVIAGTNTIPGVSADIDSDDVTTGRGVFADVFGIFIIMGRVTIGDAASADSYFRDANEVWSFIAQPYRASFNHLEFIGGTGTNEASFGTEVGSGIAAVGVGGNTFISSLNPFRVEAIESDIAVNFLGCILTNPTAKVTDVVVSCQQDDGGTFTDFTEECNDDGGTNNPTGSANDLVFFPATELVNDAMYFAYDVKFTEFEMNVTTAGVGGAIAVEYFNGTSYVSVEDLTDPSTGLTATGLHRLKWALATDWAKDTINGEGPYYHVRLRVTTVYTTNPLGDQAQVVVGGRMEWEQANAKAISCTLTGMDVISLRNGAILRKNTVTDSVASEKEAAIGLGSSDPAVDTFREMQVQNCSKGILLKGTSTGTTTYNFRDIKFAGNTKDVRVDFPATATVVINISEGGDTPTIDNVNGSTVTVQNTVTTLVNVKDNDAANLQNARVLLEANDGTGDFPFEESVTITRLGATASVAHTAHGLGNGDIVVIRGAVEQEYNGPFVITNVSTNAYDYTVSGSPATPATGTITSSGAILNGLTDASGNISVARTFSLDTPVKGSVRKSTASPRFKDFPLAGTIDNVNGLTINIRMVLDE